MPLSGLARKQQILQSLLNVSDSEIAANRHQTLAFLSSMKTEMTTEVKNKEKQRRGLDDKEFSLFNKFYEQLVKE